MLLLLTTALLTLSDAAATEDPDKAHIEVRAGSFFSADTPEIAASVRAVGSKDAYLGVEGRFDRRGDWTGRVGAGIDILGKSPFDLKVGLFMGGIGSALDYEDGFVVGSEVGLGTEIGRLYGQYRFLGGIGGSEMAALHTENELTVGARIVSELRVYGQYLHTNPFYDRPRENALGAGVAWYF